MAISVSAKSSILNFPSLTLALKSVSAKLTHPQILASLPPNTEAARRALRLMEGAGCGYVIQRFP